MKLSASLLLVAFVAFAGQRALAAKAWTCPGAGNYPSGTCAGSFYSCGGKGEEGTLLDCPAELVFNPLTSECDYKYNVTGCDVDTSDCPDAGLFPTANCASTFYSCAAKGADPIEMNCTDGTYFNPPIEACDYKEDVLGCVCTTVTAAAAATSDLSILSAILAATGANETLDNAYLNVTVFAPTNAAFTELLTSLNLTAAEALSPSMLPTITKILLTHVVPVAANAKDLTNGMVLPTLNGNQTLTAEVKPGSVQIKPEGGAAATVVKADLQACTAVVHVINKVLLPSNLA